MRNNNLYILVNIFQSPWKLGNSHVVSSCTIFSECLPKGTLSSNS